MEWIIIGSIVGIILILLLIYLIIKAKNAKTPKPPQNPLAEVKPEEIGALAAYVQADLQQKKEAQEMKDLKKAEQRQKLETFKQTRDLLKDNLKNQMDKKQWKPLESVLKSADKGGMGIYILYNETKNKYYVGQAKKIFERIREHFKVEDIAKDYMAGDVIHAKILTAGELGTAELGADYRLDHIEKVGMEIFESKETGYNKNSGNL